MNVPHTFCDTLDDRFFTTSGFRKSLRFDAYPSYAVIVRVNEAKPALMIWRTEPTLEAAETVAATFTKDGCFATVERLDDL